ncbi:hypothetical protein ACFY00_34005 [Kitasatospora sp. NPDC001540]|uniref:hypothetical protein n=1 Tax=Kitasatospora sp. NPDC001540 TaxID=3364014 RepID=UPI0036AEB113
MSAPSRPAADTGHLARQALAAFPAVVAQEPGTPGSYDERVLAGFEGGVDFSGGQWQRIGTARTYLRTTTAGTDGRRPFLVVADEPTSALDPAAEVRAFDNLRRLAEQGATVLLITHRLAASASADLIYVLEDGRLVEQGTHEELMAAEADLDGSRPGVGSYRAAHLLQARQYATATRLPGPRPEPSSPATRGEGSLR